MINLALLSAFIPTFLLVSLSPGLCMTLALTVGMNQGIRRALWMMYGELLGVAFVASASVAGVAVLWLQFPHWFYALKCIGAAYLVYTAWQMWTAKGGFSLPKHAGDRIQSRRWTLFCQGFITATSNPKAWAFLMALLPPFIDAKLAFWPQFIVLLLVLLLIELSCLLIYASAGKAMAGFFNSQAKSQILNRICACLMVAVAIWMLAF